MSGNAAPLKLVLDTNVWLDWLAFGDAATAPLERAHAAGSIEIYTDAPCTDELVAVLNYDLGKRSLDAKKQADCLAQFRKLVRIEFAAAPADRNKLLPQCRDTDDQKFLELARDCGADYLLTKDKALLVLARRKTRPPPCRIVTPHAFCEILDQRSNG